MKKRQLLTLLALCVVLAALPGTALAATLMGGTMLPAETEFTINGVTVTKASGKAGWNCAKYAVEILNQLWNVSDAMSTFDSTYNMLGGKSSEERTLTAEHVKSYIQAAPLGSRIRICADSGTTANNKDNSSQGHTMVLAAKDDAAGEFTVLHSGWGGAAACRYTYSGFAEYYSEKRNYNYFFYIANYAAADPASAVSGRSGGGLWWSYDAGTGTLTLSGSGRMPDYEPDASNPVPWRKYSRMIKTVCIQNGVTNIGNNAFSHHDSLSNVTIPPSVTEIGSEAFSYSGLTSITIPNSVTEIRSNAFAGCLKLTRITLSNRLKYISSNLFRECGSLTSVTVPSSVDWISPSAFRDCESLQDIYYSGTPDQWRQALIGDTNDVFRYTKIHCKTSGILYAYRNSAAARTTLFRTGDWHLMAPLLLGMT